MTTSSDVLAAVVERLSRSTDPQRYPDSGGEYWALCPFHPDHDLGSFSFNGKTYNCFSCGASGHLTELARHLGIEVVKRKEPSGCTLAEYASYKRLPVPFLQGIGLRDDPNQYGPRVAMPYLDEQQKVAAIRYRVSLNGAGQRFFWRKGDKAKGIPYGLPRLPESGYVIIVEGESDCHTLWHYGLPALGVPGAENWNPAWAAYLDGLQAYVWQEPDAAGETFAQKVCRSLPSALVIRPVGVKDVSQAHVKGMDVPGLVDELKAKAAPWQGMTKGSELLSLGVNDEANAEAVTLLHPGRFAYTTTHGWVQFDGVYWNADTAEAAVERAIVQTLGERIKAALAADAEAHDKLIRFCAPNASRMRGAKELLSSKVAVSHKMFDSSPDLLNCPNCVVDLRTGATTPHRPALYFMHVAGVDYDPDADYSDWHRWIVETVAGDEAIAEYLQIAVGYTLTGRTDEEVLFYLNGPPRSGKGVFMETVRLVMGDQLAKAIPFNTLTAPADVDAQNFALAPLKPTRLVLASESNQYERLNEAKLKAITGGDAISCAFKHRDAFNYRPQFKVWLASNQPINADPDDDAVWGRIRLIQFPISHLGKEDKSLKDRMRRPENLRAVLAWAVAGAVKWYALGAAGLPELQRMTIAKDVQRSEVDHVQQWLDDCCKFAGGDVFTPSRDLYTSYREWCSDNGVSAKLARLFSASLKAKGYVNDQKRVPGKVNPARGFFGLVLL